MASPRRLHLLVIVACLSAPTKVPLTRTLASGVGRSTHDRDRLPGRGGPLPRPTSPGRISRPLRILFRPLQAILSRPSSQAVSWHGAARSVGYRGDHFVPWGGPHMAKTAADKDRARSE